MEQIVEAGSPLKNSEETYKTQSTDIEDRLKKLEEREELINRKYTEQFNKMEQAMTRFNTQKPCWKISLKLGKNRNSL